MAEGTEMKLKSSWVVEKQRQSRSFDEEFQVAVGSLELIDKLEEHLVLADGAVEEEKLASNNLPFKARNAIWLSKVDDLRTFIVGICVLEMKTVAVEKRARCHD